MTRQAMLFLFLIGLTGFVALAADAPTDAASDAAAARSTVGKWVGTQQIMTRERKEWQQGKEILLSRIDLVTKEIEQLEQKIAEADRNAGDASSRGAQLALDNREFVDLGAFLANAVGEMEGQVRRVYKVLPPHVQQTVAPLFQRMPASPAETKVSVAERFQNVLGILNEINKVNNDIALTTEVRALSDGKPSEVRTVYVGLGQGYFLSAKGEAGVGWPTADGWTWQPANDKAPDITQVIEILQNKGKPRFVAVPVQIQ